MPRTSQKPKGPAGRPALLAFALSFLIYAIPIFNPHAGFVFWFPALLRGLGEATSLGIAYTAGAIGLQALTGVIFYWVLRRKGLLRLFLLLPLAPILLFAVNFSFLYAIPLLVLVEYDASADFGELELSCKASGFSLDPVQSGIALEMERAGKVWLRGDDGRSFAQLALPGCQTVFSFRVDEPSTLISAAPGGRALVTTYHQSFTVFSPQNETAETFSMPDGLDHWRPILTDDGSKLAWLGRDPGQPAPSPYLVSLRRIDAPKKSESFLVNVDPRQSLTMVGAGNGNFTFFSYPNKYFTVDDSGDVIWGPVSVPGLASPRFNFRRIDNETWFAWDGYREEGQAQIYWSTPRGEGHIIIPRGRSIEAVAISPDGAHLAYSTEGMGYFSISGRLVVVRIDDQKLIYRRRLEQFDRVGLAFLGESHLAIRDYASDKTAVNVYRLPSSNTP